MKYKTVILAYLILLFSYGAPLHDCSYGGAPRDAKSDVNIQKQVQRLGHGEHTVQKEAAKALVEIGKPAVPALMTAMNREEYTLLSLNASRVLAQLGDAAMGQLIYALGSPNVKMRRRVPDALCWMVRYNSISATAAEEEIIPALIKALKDADEAVRDAVTNAIATVIFERKGVKQPAIEALLIKALIESHNFDAPYFNRAASTLLFWRLGPPGKTALLDTLTHKTWGYRFGAALGYVFQTTGGLEPDLAPLPPDIIPILAEGLTKADEHTQTHAAESLSRLNKINFSSLPEASQNHDEPLNIGPETQEALPALIRAKNNDNDKVREAAAVALGMIGKSVPDAVPILIRMLRDESDSVRQMVVIQLGKIGTPVALKAIEGFTEPHPQKIRVRRD